MRLGIVCLTYGVSTGLDTRCSSSTDAIAVVLSYYSNTILLNKQYKKYYKKISQPWSNRKQNLMAFHLMCADIRLDESRLFLWVLTPLALTVVDAFPLSSLIRPNHSRHNNIFLQKWPHKYICQNTTTTKIIAQKTCKIQAATSSPSSPRYSPPPLSFAVCTAAYGANSSNSNRHHPTILTMSHSISASGTTKDGASSTLQPEDSSSSNLVTNIPISWSSTPIGKRPELFRSSRWYWEASSYCSGCVRDASVPLTTVGAEASGNSRRYPIWHAVSPKECRFYYWIVMHATTI